MRSSSQKRWSCRRVMPAGLVLMLVSVVALGASAPKFYKDDPIAVEPETQDASGVVYRKIDLFYDLMRNQFTQPGDPATPRARMSIPSTRCRIPVGLPTASWHAR